MESESEFETDLKSQERRRFHHGAGSGIGIGSNIGVGTMIGIGSITGIRDGEG